MGKATFLGKATDPILFNKNLNVIVGGKSSGKSILLYSMAKTLLADRKLLKKIDPNSGEETYRYSSIIDGDFDFEVKIGSGNIQSIKRTDEEPSILPEIKYIPQNYLSRLVEPENKKGNELRKYIRELLLENDFYKTKYQKFIEKVKSNDSKRENLINNYFAIRDKINSLKSDLASKGNERVLEANIFLNDEKIKKLKSKIGLTKEQIKEYNSYNQELENINIEIPKIQSDQSKIRSFNDDIKNTLSELSQKRDLVSDSIQNENIKKSFISEYKILDSDIERLELLTEKINNIFQEQYLSIYKKKENLEAKLNPLVEDQEIRKQIKSLEEKITDDKQKLGAIRHAKLEVANNEKALIQEKNRIFDLYRENYKEYENIVSELEKRANLLKNDSLEIKGFPRLNFPKFRKEIFKISDGRKNPTYYSYHIFDRNLSGESICNIDEIIKNLKSIFPTVIDTKEHAFGQSDEDRKNAIKVLLRDYFFDYWEAVYDNDKLYEMSTGKASFVMLMIIVGLSNSKAPILIDQPEDNLDNRSITKDLINYLRAKKLDRQIILVTHNPNIVVNADAENIIVANQKGQNDRGTTSPYTFDYTNGALEFTKPRDENEGNLLKSMGIREHVADIVEGGEDAFKKREAKYGFKS